METFLSGLDLLMRWDVALALIIGSVGGVVIGAISCVGAAVAIAILLPATFSLDPIVGAYCFAWHLRVIYVWRRASCGIDQYSRYGSQCFDDL